MKITPNMIEERYAPTELGKLIREKYSSGVKVIDLLDEELSLSSLHFIRDSFTLDDKELKKYFFLCGIDLESKYVYDSDNVESSAHVLKSSNIIDSDYIFTGTDILNSSQVYNSLNVKNSSNINYSKDIVDSSEIYNCTDIRESNKILDSHKVSWSTNITFSEEISDSRFIYRSINLIESLFCGFCKNSHHLLFCSGIENESYMIFNQKVDLQTFENWKENLYMILSSEKSDFLSINQNLFFEDRFNISRRFDAIFDGLSPKFYGMVGNFPNYSEDIFLQIFFKKFEKNIKN